MENILSKILNFIYKFEKTKAYDAMNKFFDHIVYLIALWLIGSYFTIRPEITESEKFYVEWTFTILNWYVYFGLAFYFLKMIFHFISDSINAHSDKVNDQLIESAIAGKK